MEFKFQGMNNVDDPSSVGKRYDPATRKTYFECVLMQNVDMDNDGGFSTRLGRTVVLAGNYRSGWSDGVKSFVVKGSSLYSFNGTTETLVTALSNSTNPVVFTPVNDVVVYSNGIDFGVIENGIAYTIPIPTEAFKEKMIPGNVLAFMPPVLLVGVGDTVYRSDPLRCDQMDRQNNLFAKFRDEALLILPVDDGCYVITVNDTWWFGGTFDDENSQRLIADYGGVKGTGVITTGEKIKVSQLAGTVAIWLSKQGICVGGNGGHFINLSSGKASFDCGESGSAVLREQNGLLHYIACTGSSVEAYNQYIPPTLDVDTQDL